MSGAAADDHDRLSHLSGRDERPIAELLVYVGLELRSLCTAAAHVEHSVETLIGEAPAERPETLQGLQELDRLIQHMDGLADYLAALAEATRGLGSIDPSEARRVLKLARLRDGLAGRPSEAEAREDPDPSGGDMEFF